MCSVTGAESGEDVISMGLPDTRSLAGAALRAGVRRLPVWPRSPAASFRPSQNS